MKRLLFALALRALLLLPTPPKQDQWQCKDCDSWNAAELTRCRNCQYPPADKPRPTADEDAK